MVEESSSDKEEEPATLAEKARSGSIFQKGKVDRERLKEVMKGCVDYTIDTLWGMAVTSDFEQEWGDFVMMSNCLRDPDHARYMVGDVKDMLLLHYRGLSYELHRVDRQIYVEVFQEVVLESADRIKGYWGEGLVR